MHNSRTAFNDLLKSALYTEEFRVQLALLLDRDPFFFPVYLEFIWLAEMEQNVISIDELVTEAQKKIRFLYENKQIRLDVIKHWSDLEKDAVRVLLGMCPQNASWGYRQLIKRQKSIIDRMFPVTSSQSKTPSVYLAKREAIDPAPLQKEFSDVPSYMWAVGTSRALTNPYHQKTHSIMLRVLENHDPEYTPKDGPHEGIPTIFNQRFPAVSNAVMNFASQRDLCLGRVAIVRLQGGAQAYRHYDIEPHLVGRDRYHLVVDCGADNILSSGDEEASVQPGEFWFFDNKAMHRAHNKSDKPRIHVIFDTYKKPAK